MVKMKDTRVAVSADTEPCQSCIRGNYIVCKRKNNARMGFLKELILKLGEEFDGMRRIGEKNIPYQ